MTTAYQAKGKVLNFFDKITGSEKKQSGPVFPSPTPPRPSSHNSRPSNSSNDLVTGFNALALSESDSRHQGFVGGFYSQPPSGPYSRPSGMSTDNPSRPSPIPMPIPNTGHLVPSQTSLTMQHALSGTPYSSYSDTRPVSASHLPSPAYHFSPAASPQPSPGYGGSPPRPPVGANGTGTSKPSTPTKPTKPKRPRATSSPPPAKPSISRTGSSDDEMQCAGITKAGKRCTRKVKTGSALSNMMGAQSGDIDRFCFQHSKDLLSPSGFYARKNGDWLKFEDWIPSYLTQETQVALRNEMEKAKAASDEDGYIYAFEIRDPTSPRTIKLKVGRAVNLTKRIDQWSKQCKSKEQVLRGWYPGVVYPDDGSAPDGNGVSLMKGRVVAGEKGACCHRMERLIHLELADLVASGIYLDKQWPNTSSGKATVSANASPRKGSGKKCSDCGQVHKEIFEFTRVQRGHYAGREWESIVKPIIEKWGGFVDNYL